MVSANADEGGDVARRQRVGIYYALMAYGAWGVFPVYFKVIGEVPALEVLGHRVLWSVMLLPILLTMRGAWGEVRGVLRNRRSVGLLCLTTCLIGTNWYLFVWAVAHGRVLDASLGYFINPLVNVALGVVILRERLSRLQWAALGLAAAGVGVMAAGLGGVPWVSLVLAVSFGFYTLLRKQAKAGAMAGLAVETALLFPAAFGFLLWLWMRGEGGFMSGSLKLDLLLPVAGLVTTLPLIWFTEAARRLRLATIGVLQYIAPTGQLLIGVLYGEAFTVWHGVAFGCIWGAIVVFSFDSLRDARRGRGSHSG